MGTAGKAGGFLQGFMTGFDRSADRSLRRKEAKEKETINKQMLEIQEYEFEQTKTVQAEDDETAAALVQSADYRHLFEQPVEGRVKAASQYKLPGVLRIIELDTKKRAAKSEAAYKSDMLKLQGTIKTLTQERMTAKAKTETIQTQQAVAQIRQTNMALFKNLEENFPDLAKALGENVADLDQMDPKIFMSMMDTSIKQRLTGQPKAGEIMTLYSALIKAQSDMRNKKTAALQEPGLTQDRIALIEANHQTYEDEFARRIEKLEAAMAQFQQPGFMAPQGAGGPPQAAGGPPQVPGPSQGAGGPPSPVGGVGGVTGAPQGLMDYYRNPPSEQPPSGQPPSEEQYTGKLMF
jgi:hypothetical protein